MTKLIPPVINSNGTSVDELLSRQRDVIDALHEVMDALNEATPHGRDYQTLEPSVGRDARRAHGERWIIINNIREEYIQQAIAISKQKR